MLATIVNTTLLPAAGVGLSTDFVTPKFDDAVGVGVLVLLLLTGVGSASVADIVAVFAKFPVAFTVAVIDRI